MGLNIGSSGRARKVLDEIVDRLFARPRGLLGRVGGKLMARTNADVVQWTLSILDIQPEDHLLEIGFGPGVGIQHAIRLTEGFVAGVDPSKVMVRQARERNATAVRRGSVRLVRGSVTDLPYEDATFDKAFSINSLQVWSDSHTGLREVHRVLKPGGEIALTLTEHAGHHDSFEELLTDVGFDIVRIDRSELGRCVIAQKRRESPVFVD